MTTDQSAPPSGERGLSPADLHNVRFTRGTMLRPGYVDSEVDRVLSRVAEELGRLYAEKAALRDQVRSLQAQIDGVVIPVAPSEQAVRILSTAQQTADNYVAEAEEFSRQVTSEARSEYEEAVRMAREKAGAIIQAAQETATRITGQAGGGPADGERSAEELAEQVAYLKAFGQACRVQLRSYLEALLSDVETEWGRADPAAVPAGAARPPAPRPQALPGSSSTSFEANTAAETPDAVDGEVVSAGAGGARRSTGGARRR
jgi:DivIVA domain-containing protein